MSMLVPEAQTKNDCKYTDFTGLKINIVNVTLSHCFYERSNNSYPSLIKTKQQLKTRGFIIS